MVTRFRILAAATSIRRLVARPANPRYKTVLSIDGGGIRGIIPVTVLQRLEQNIKEHILENKEKLIPDDSTNINSIQDFDVDLTDYFDMTAGTSIGSWIALYIAGRGVGGDAILEDANIRSSYPNVRRGSMETAKAVFHALGEEVFPPRNTFHRLGRLFRPLYPATGVESVLRKMFSDATLEDLETGCLVTAYDQDRHAATSFMRGPINGGTSYTVRAEPRERPRKAAEEAYDWRPDLNIQRNTNYYLRDLATASAAAPTYFPPHTMTRMDIDNGEKMTLVDGGLVSNNPALQALTFIPEAFNCSIRDVAMFSVGCGTADPNYPTRQNPGIGWWLRSGYLFDIMFNGTSELVQSVIDYWMYGSLGLYYGQYLRIQKSAPPDSELGEVLGSTDGVRYLDVLQKIGTELANTNDREIKAFVRDYIFAT